MTTYLQSFLPGRLVRSIIYTGTAQLEGEGKKRVVIINIFSFVSIVLCLLFGAATYFLTGKTGILVPAYIEALLFVVVLMLNRFRQHNMAAVLTTLIHNSSIVHFSALLGMVTEAYLLFFFLLGAALTIFHRQKVLIMASIAISVICIFLCELNLYDNFTTPLPLSVNDQFRIRWVTIPAILVLDVLTFAIYVRALRRNNDLLQRKADDLMMADKVKTRQAMETSHEVRNPFNAVYGITQELMLKVQQGDKYKDIKSSVEHLYSASHNVLQILNNNLELYRLQQGVETKVENTTFNVREWAAETTNIYQYIANVRDVTISLEVDANMPAIIAADKIKLTQILNNLLFNAIKFTNAGSPVTVKISREDATWQLQVKDSGAGIPADKLSKIFVPYVTEQHAFGGTGLGLPIVKGFVNLMGGTINVSSVAGEGSVFTVSLPLINAGPAGPADLPKPATRAINLQTFQGLKALVIDDNEMSNMILAKFLERMECNVTKAFSGAEGITLAISTHPDIIFLDTHMPDMDGKATMTALQEISALRDTPVVAVSGDASKESIDEMLQAGARDYITKPIDIKSLNQLLAKITNYELPITD